MPVVSVLLNLLWLLFGGIWMSAGWLVAALIMAITIVGIPWARVALMMASYTLLPFGQTVLPRNVVEGRPAVGTGPLGTLGNLLWLVLAGWWLALGHLITALGLAVTIIGIPFAWAHLKLAGLSLWPVGRTVVTIQEADRILSGRGALAGRV
ncbi:MAG: YccF domain-containing protein [Alsobacter sp.]